MKNKLLLLVMALILLASTFVNIANADAAPVGVHQEKRMSDEMPKKNLRLLLPEVEEKTERLIDSQLVTSTATAETSLMAKADNSPTLKESNSSLSDSKEELERTRYQGKQKGSSVEQKPEEETQVKTVLTVSKGNPLDTVKVVDVKVASTKHYSEKQIRALVPELDKEDVKIGRLSHQIQLVNDSGALELATELRPLSEDSFQAELKAEEKKAETFSVNVNNTGNKYTGDIRMGVTYLNRNFTGVSDSFGVAYATSPGHWADVKQAAVVYRAILPKAGDSLYATYSWSDVDLGTVGDFGGLGITATGRGTMAGVHYQHNFKYSKAHRQFLEIGFDQKHYKNGTAYEYSGMTIRDNVNYDVPMLSVSYTDIRRRTGQYFSWSLGYMCNLKKDAGFLLNRANSSDHFHLWQASLQYQRRWQNDWIFGARLNGQYSAQNVVTTEQFGAGGMMSVRGFKERAVYADKGWMGSLELYTPEFIKNSRFVFFTDFAHLSNNQPRRGELSSGSIGSYGLGFRYNDKKSGFFLSVDYAHAYKNVNNANDNLRPWHIMAGINF